MASLKLHHSNSLVTSLGTLPYLSHEPPGFAVEKRPLVLFLHGAEERGDSLPRICARGLPALVERGQNVPFITIAPLCPAEAYWTGLVIPLRELIEHVVSARNVDERRIYLTGVGMGGMGAFKLAAELHGRFAALVPVCGSGDPAWASRLAHVPTWAFHCSEDRTLPVSASETMVTAIRAAGGNVQLSTYAASDEDRYTVPYENTELFEWLLKQQLSERTTWDGTSDDPGTARASSSPGDRHDVLTT
jgi:predicted peptidase